MLKLKKPEEFVGSQCIYYIFRFFTIIQLLIGLGTLIVGIFILIQITVVNWYAIGYIITGLVIFILALFSHSTYKSTTRLIFFLTLLFLSFCSELIITIIVYLQQTFDKSIGTQYTTIAEYCFLGASVVLLLDFTFGSWYLSSVRDAEIEKETLRLLNNN